MTNVTTRSPGDSLEQREAEKIIVEEVSKALGVSLRPATLNLGGGCHLAVDGVSERPAILCEAWAHLGAPKSGQKQKVMMDAFKLAFAAQRWEHHNPRLVLAFADDAAARPFRGRSWMAQALRAFGVSIYVVGDLPEATRAALLAAQHRQRR